MNRARPPARICWEESDSIRPHDYQQPEQIPCIDEAHQVMGKRIDIALTVPSAMCVDPEDLGFLAECYPAWKGSRDIDFRILDYGMLGITKPVTAADEQAAMESRCGNTPLTRITRRPQGR